MDKRSWPWKKKSSDKQVAEKAAATPSDSSTAASDISAAQIEKVLYFFYFDLIDSHVLIIDYMHLLFLPSHVIYLIYTGFHVQGISCSV